MTAGFAVLSLTAASVGVLHTLLGPDHYLPFVFMGRAWRWSHRRLLLVTLGCGVGHVLGSVALGALGIALGLAVARLEWLQSVRGEVATWGLIAFGLVYAAWGWRQAQRHRPHTHAHAHGGGTVHAHEHVHEKEHVHVHGERLDLVRVTPWVLFTIFVFGPCEPLIPLLMLPAAQGDLHGVLFVVVAYGAATLATMAAVVTLCSAGMQRLPLAHLERYTHLLAGVTVALCGFAMRFLGL